MAKVTNPPGTACFTYASCLALLKAGTKINYEGASGDLDYNQYNNTFGPYGAFKATAAGLEPQAVGMSAQALAAATPWPRPRLARPPPGRSPPTNAPPRPSPDTEPSRAQL